MRERAILHSDANCFYASCEIAMNPSLRDKAIAVCGSTEERRGIVLAKSELAKRAGVLTGMTNGEALSKCPSLIMLPPHFELYSKFSQELHKIYQRYTDLIEPFGLDECWLDVTDSIREPTEIAEEIRESVKRELGITVSIGVSFNKSLAKLGSDLKKPDAITVLSRENYKEIIYKLPCSSLLYCGRHTSEKLERMRVFTIGGLASMPLDFIEKRLGKNGAMLWSYANGIDPSPVKHMDERDPQKSIGHGITCVENLSTLDEAEKVLVALAQDIGYKMRSMKLCARGVSITIKNENLTTFSFQAKLENAIQDEAKLAKEASSLLKKNYNWQFKIRALTVTAIDLVSEDMPVQADMFYDYAGEKKRKKLYSVIDEINDTYGKKSILPATVLDEKKMPKGH